MKTVLIFTPFEVETTTSVRRHRRDRSGGGNVGGQFSSWHHGLHVCARHPRNFVLRPQLLPDELFGGVPLRLVQGGHTPGVVVVLVLRVRVVLHLAQKNVASSLCRDQVLRQHFVGVARRGEHLHFSVVRCHFSPRRHVEFRRHRHRLPQPGVSTERHSHPVSSQFHQRRFLRPCEKEVHRARRAQPLQEQQRVQHHRITFVHFLRRLDHVEVQLAMPPQRREVPRVQVRDAAHDGDGVPQHLRVAARVDPD
mmetsp:Transcript_25490/g.64245  ORF Transcript_25490/g.64245 Transcript_25490/m.64245 type:complete len:252 (-) Transcript_25490:578-1333(-)